jgi:PAS domain-containing protein
METSHAREAGKSEIVAPTKDELFGCIVESAIGFAIFTMDQGGTVTSWSLGSQGLLGYSEEEIIGQSGDVIFTQDDRSQGIPELERATALGNGRAEDERWHLSCPMFYQRPSKICVPVS